MTRATTGFPSKRATRLTLSRSQIEEVYREAIPSLYITGKTEATGRCPFHDDRHPSFSVNLDQGIWNCHTGCGGGNIYQFVARQEGIDISKVDHYLQRRFGVTQPERPAVRKRGIIRQYHWKDAAGHEAWKLRWDHGAKFTWAKDKDGRVPQQGECQFTLYWLQEIAAVPKVIIVEGERDADTINGWLQSLGISDMLATCTPNGASDVKPTYATLLRGKDEVWVSGDNDPAGQGYLERWGALLQGVVSKLYRLPVPVGCKDWTEWQEHGGIAERLRQLLDQAVTFVPTHREKARWEPPAEKEVKDSSSPADVAEAFLERTEYLNEEGQFLRWHQGQWYSYDGKVFSPFPIEDLKAEIMEFLQRTPARAKARGSFVGDVLLNLKALCRMTPPSVTLPARWVRRGECVSRPQCIVVQNGIVNLAELFAGEFEDALTDHTPDFVSTVCLPFRFEPEALCPRWETFLAQVLPDPECRQLLQEIFGYCLTYDTSQQKFFMFEGNGGNGKGVVQQVLMSLLGERNVSSLPLESFSETHALVVTLGKLVNIASEAGNFDKVGEEQLKRFTGEDLMHFNPKYRDAFSARPTARLILSTNVRPPFNDRSDGLWRRLILLPFPVTISEKERNPRLSQELVSELSGIFNWAVIGAWSLHERGRFIEPESSRVARETFQREANPARLFLEENYEVRPNGDVGKDELYRLYRQHCDTHGQKPLNATNFSKEVVRVFPRAEVKRPRRGGSRSHRYMGIAGRARERQEEMDRGIEAA